MRLRLPIILLLNLAFSCSAWAVWTPPVGIPEPNFGITETYRMYDADAEPNVRNESLTYHLNTEGGYYTHYVDMNDVNATDTTNIYGTIAKPRKTFPAIAYVLPGSVVEVHGGVYTTNYEALINGTATQPIFIRGLSTDKPVRRAEIRIRGHHIIVENIKFDRNQQLYSAVFVRRVQVTDDVRFVCVRNCEVYNSRGSGFFPGGSPDSTCVQDVVFYNNYVHQGNMIAPGVPGDPTGVGIGVGGHADRIWIVDNHLSNMAGDCIGSGHDAQYTAKNYYIGRNILHDTTENAVDLKEVDTAVISENVMYHFVGGSEGQKSGVAVVLHYGPHYSPKNVWVINNEIYDCNGSAIQVGGAQEWPVYIINNKIHDIRNDIVQPYMFAAYPEGADIFDRLVTKDYVNSDGEVNVAFTDFDAEFEGWFEAEYAYFDYIKWALDKALNRGGTASGISAWSCKQVYLLNNTFAKVDNALNWEPANGTLFFCNNIVSTLTNTGLHIDLSSSRDTATITNSLFYQPGGGCNIKWDTTTYTTLAAFQAAREKGQDCIEADPLFTDEDANDFTLQVKSSCIDAASATTFESLCYFFETLFGLDIRTDYTGVADVREAGSNVDIGAYEYTDGTPDPENHAPVLTGIGAKSVLENRLLTFDIEGTDEDLDPLTYSFFDIPPSGASLSTATFSWTPNYSQSGTYTITFGVTDGELWDYEAVTVTVTDVLQYFIGY